VVRVCGAKRYVLKVLIAGFVTLSFLLAICAYYGVWGAAGPISAIRGVGVACPPRQKKDPLPLPNLSLNT
jgi:hypothetical protein